MVARRSSGTKHGGVYRRSPVPQNLLMDRDWARERADMVESQLRRRGIHDPRVLAAMNSVPRERFIDSSFRDLAYADDPAPIGGGQTISQPYMTALMCQCLALTGTESVL